MVLAITLTLALTAAGAALPPFVHETWGTKEGLPQSSVTAVLQTSDGYLWLGTQGGLVRFDGVRFTLFSPSTAGLRSSRIRTLHEDADGALWIGTEDGGLITFKNGIFTPFGSADVSFSTVSNIGAGSAGRKWLGTPAGLIEIRGGRAIQHRRHDGSLLVPESAIVEDGTGAVWFGTRWGLVRFTPDRLTTYTIADGLPHTTVRALLKGRDGSLWVGTDGGLARFTGGRVSSVYGTDLPDPRVLALHEDVHGNVWMGTQVGLYLLAGGHLAPLPSPAALATDTILSIASDGEGNVWVGTLINGLVRLKTARVRMLAVNEGGSDSIVPITQDRDGAMWVGATCDGLLRYRDGVRRLFTARDGLPPECIWSLLADRNGALWIGTWGGGLARLQDGSVRTFTHRNSGLTHDVVLALFQDRRGVVWIGTLGGLHAYQDGVFTAYRTADGLVDDDVRFITEDRHGVIWVGTTNGVSRFAGGRFTNYTTADGLSHNSVRAIHEDADGTIWIGTYGGGLTRFKDGRLAAITSAHGLFDDVVSRILEDERGFLWMSGNRGIFRVSRQGLNDVADGRTASVTSISYGVTDGMKNRETNGGAQPAGWRARNGHLWFPTIDGVAIIDPAAPHNAIPPPIAIERITVDNRELGRAGPIVLPSGRMQLAIEYTGLSLVAPENTQFRYRLEGYEDAPVEAGTRRIAYYTSLPPGSYTFRVSGSNNDGIWNTAGATLAIVVTAPFWMTWWFRGLLGLTFAAMALTVHRARVATLKREQQVQVAFTRQLIESQEAERARVARELHDTLGQSLVLIKSQALIGLNQLPAERTSTISEISSMATQAIAEVKEIAYNLRPYQLDRLGLTKALEALMARVASSTSLRITTRIANLDGRLSKEAEITLYRIVQESINNIVKHAQATTIDVEIDAPAPGVTGRIRDDGRGFAVAATTRSTHGLGLSGMTERARMLGARLDVVSAPERGTTVTVTIPASEGGP